MGCGSRDIAEIVPAGLARASRPVLATVVSKAELAAPSGSPERDLELSVW
jgi:hypothetical protein